jgi:DNA (cytosine-5)-methyltransferase 1
MVIKACSYYIYLYINSIMLIHIGTDCSGIEAPIEALKKICINNKLSFKHKFSSETNKYAIDCIKENNYPEIIFGDIQTRDIDEVPDIDIYVSGFPCQPYSRANKFKTNVDPRLNLFENCLDVIFKKKPSCFILENVKTLVTLNNGYYFNDILNRLNKNNLYDINWKVINSKDQGIPQCRDRLYIIGILKTKIIDKFVFPDNITMKPLIEFIDESCNDINIIKSTNIELFKNIPKDSIFIDIGFRKANFPNSNQWAPCITAQPNMWCVPKQRKATIKEYLKLQGFPETYKKPQNVSNHQLKIRIGNSMTVNVIERLMINIFKSLNWI